MWPTSRGYGNPVKPSNAVQQQPSQQQINKSMASVDTNQLLMAADSLRTLFGENISSNLLNSIRDNPSANRMDTSLSQMTSRRPPERHVIEYENPNYSRLDRSRLSQMTSDFSSSEQRFNDSPPLRTETRIYDPSKMPQKSILKKSNPSFETSAFRSIEEEDMYLYGKPGPSGSLPPGIVSLEQQSERSPPNERSLSPISLRLKREMERMDRSRRQSEPKQDDSLWTGMSGMNSEEPIHRREWNNEEELYKRRYSDLMNPSPDHSLELEKVRIQQLAAIQAGILTQSDKTTKRRQMSPKSPLSTYRRGSPESNSKRVRRRSPSLSPRRRRSISPRRRSRSPRQRSRSPRQRSGSPRRSISPRNRRGYQSRSRSRDRRRSRSRSRSPPRPRSPNPLNNQMNFINPINPMPPMMRMPAPGMPFMPPHHNLVGVPMGPIMGPYMPPHPMQAPYQPFVSQNNISPKQGPRPMLKEVPIVKTTGAQSSAKKPTDKKDDKLLNAHDLLVAERAKLRDELEEVKKQFQKKKEEQENIAKRDGGTDSYAYRQLDKTIKDLRDAIDSKHEKLIKNFGLINDVQKSKSKAKSVMEQLKASGDISKVDLKKKETTIKSKSSPNKTKSPDKKSAKEQPKQNQKEEIEEEEDEKSSRFHYFDSGPHWCKDCNKFLDNMKQYFNHIHSKEHFSKQKESMKTPWITKDYIKEMDKSVTRNKDQLVVASKGIHFILPTHGFFCELCNQFLHDSYQAEKHFKSAKHNRGYTRYTLLHNEYEHKWKAERDRAFTDMKKKEREAEKEKHKKEAEKKIEDRKRLEEEVKRKDKEVKEKIEAMNKNLKTVKELDDPKTEQKKDDRSKSSPKSSIRLNLSSPKSSSETNGRSKSSERNSDKKDKPKDKSEDKSKRLTKDGDSMETSEGIEDMLIIDEINCDSMEDNTENHKSNENIDENSLLNPEINEIDPKVTSESNGTEENKTENSEKTAENVIEIMDTSAEEVSKPIIEENSNSDENTTELNDKKYENYEQIEGVMPGINVNLIAENSIEDPKVSELISEDKQESSDDYKNASEDNTNNENVSNTEDISINETTEPIEEKSNDGCADTRTKTYAEVVANGSDGFHVEDKGLNCIKIEDIPPEQISNIGSIGTEEPEIENNTHLLDTKSIKTEDMFDIDLDIEKFNERLRNLDSMVKKEEADPDEDDPLDPLDGFDVIDETNNEDNIRSEDSSKEVIELSD